MHTVCFSGGKILRGGKWESENFYVADGFCSDPIANPSKHFSVEGDWIVPGLIDLQINGAFGYDFTSQPESIVEVAKRLPALGVTAFLPTLVSTDLSRYSRAIQALKTAQQTPLAAFPIGLHFEGPFLSPHFPGAHSSDYLHDPVFYQNLNGVSLVTLAPELEGAIDLISTLTKEGIVVSLGHTAASADIVECAVKAGAKLITHLFNAMPSLHHREIGPIGIALLKQRVPYTLIADGIHVDPEVIAMAWKLHPAGAILISDGMAGMGMGSGKYRLGDLIVCSDAKTAVVEGTKTLAGAVASLFQAVVNLVTWAGATWAEGFETATCRPALLLNQAHLRGDLQVNQRADFILIDSISKEVKACYVAGKVCWCLPQYRELLKGGL